MLCAAGPCAATQTCVRPVMCAAAHTSCVMNLVCGCTHPHVRLLKFSCAVAPFIIKTGDLEFIKVHNSAIFLEATIQGKKIQISKRIIRESLQIDDKPEYSMEIDVHQTQDVLDHMGYEGTFPLTIKKLLPPCSKNLGHVFVSCISGRRSATDEISLVNTGAITALAFGIEFNFSKFIVHELVLNIEGNKRDKILMYPRFL
ncbi:unnamed protein product [Lactuca saligna]|uniref:Uncharacterized protein n=1 Tax=Lactuca saligna TaxID=75948 RepID=A0AA35XZ97_LACSI|nr:unnamed protein product [Lactuca saligna]